MKAEVLTIGDELLRGEIQLELDESRAAPLHSSQRAMMKQNLRVVVGALDREFSARTQYRAGAVRTAAQNLIRRLEPGA